MEAPLPSAGRAKAGLVFAVARNRESEYLKKTGPVV